MIKIKKSVLIIVSVLLLLILFIPYIKAEILTLKYGADNRVFNLDFDAVHVHLPKVFPNKHIPVGSIVSGMYSGLNLGGDSRK